MKYINNYSACTRTYATLRIYPKNGHPGLVTDLLSIKPSRISVAGVTGQKHVNGWFLSTHKKLKSKDTRRHIDWLLDKISHLSKEIFELQKQGAQMEIFCFWGSASGNGGPIISPEQMKRLVALNLAVSWDVWFEGEDDSNNV